MRFYEATQRLSCAELAQFDGRARGDNVMGNFTVSKLRASQVTTAAAPIRKLALCASECTVGKLAYKLSAPLHKAGSWLLTIEGRCQ